MKLELSIWMGGIRTVPDRKYWGSCGEASRQRCLSSFSPSKCAKVNVLSIFDNAEEDNQFVKTGYLRVTPGAGYADQAAEETEGRKELRLSNFKGK